MTQQETRDQRSRTDGHDREKERRDEHQRPRRNPRLVYSDPDRFFNDLLMEQQEQG